MRLLGCVPCDVLCYIEDARDDSTKIDASLTWRGRCQVRQAWQIASAKHLIHGQIETCAIAGVDADAVFCSGWTAYCGELLGRLQLLHLRLWPHRQWKDFHNAGTSDRRGPPEPGQRQACCVVVLHSIMHTFCASRSRVFNCPAVTSVYILYSTLLQCAGTSPCDADTSSPSFVEQTWAVGLWKITV